MGDHYYAHARAPVIIFVSQACAWEAPASPLNGAYPEVLGTKWDSRLALGGKQRHGVRAEYGDQLRRAREETRASEVKAARLALHKVSGHGRLHGLQFVSANLSTELCSSLA